ncbi:MAG TPA: hypothetical protein VIA62_27675 [Thermoanaerobaculia bacterium]|jgi:hypothetical protein|nr:hypothetical protein [Thermoanaerobaculia bacterium]
MDDEDVVEQLRQLAWAVPISRDHLLKVADREPMPPHFRERAQKTAGQLTDLCARLQKLNASLPSDPAMLASLNENLSGLRFSIEMTLRNVDLLIGDLHRLLDELDDGDGPPEIAN